jgi:hypothetical protein
MQLFMTPIFIPRLALAPFILAALTLLLAGCGTTKPKQTQLERVAKDWCLTLRASQVIPVYPLTEDVQPGDVFLVQVPLGRQQEMYIEKGFLPLDNHLTRLHPNGYPGFYSHSFLNHTTNTLPHDWIRPGNTNSWTLAPHAAFPSYSFSIRKGQGINLAIPIQGVPVGLSLMNSDAADGTVTIKDARTLGVDMASLYQQLRVWAKAHTDLLSSYAAVADGPTNYLRVVTRIYATAGMDVSLRDASARQGGADAGAAKPVESLFAKLPAGSTNVTEANAHNYTNALGILNSGLATSLARDAAGKFMPGGSVRVTAAGSRTVSLREDFDPPLVLGYLGFDCIILEDGFPGEPIPTYAHLNPDFGVNAQRAKVIDFGKVQEQQQATFAILAAIYNRSNKEQKREIREQAVSQGLMPSADDDSDWLSTLSTRVDPNNPQRLKEFQELLQAILKLD